ncbi:MAG: helix-turn-helix transcriptional regulator [Candidatus Paceibacterota bacterium]
MKNDNINAFIGSRIKIAREESKLSQADLAKVLDYESSTAVSLIESGQRKLRVEDLQKVADFLHRDMKYFVGQEDQPMDVKVALRADKDLNNADQKNILNFIDFVKQKKNGK